MRREVVGTVSTPCERRGEIDFCGDWLEGDRGVGLRHSHGLDGRAGGG